jgi:hypothetical protein
MPKHWRKPRWGTFHENPPENERTTADRLSTIPTLFWGMFSVALALIFVGLLFLLWQHHG